MANSKPIDAPRRLQAQDPEIRDVLALIRRAFAEMNSRIDPPSSVHLLTEDRLRRDATCGEIWTIGMPPKACVLLKRRAHALYLGKLAVDAASRGRGFAKRLVQMAEERAADLRLTALELETRVELLENHAVFAALGFEIVGYGRHEGFDTDTFVVMRKSI